MLPLSQGNSVLDALLTAREELITQFKSSGSCEHCTVEFGLGHGDRMITLSPWSIGLVQLTSQCGWAALTQLHAALGVWVGVEVGGQRFHRLNSQLLFPGRCHCTESRYFACHGVHNSMKLWSPVSHQRQALLISRWRVSFFPLKQSSQSLTEFLRWESVGAHWFLCALRKIASALIGTEEQAAFWSRAQLCWKKLMMSSHLTLWARKHVG